ncbi:hypothetical protein Nepgr_032172 [Nepenthes gracilis]|uniref:Uncharacterized protein n=1 Tax=Nepenthes gracilis TaxID=150966 RepID=A0AAD3Y7P0_NEPGR|nr:hypothetical protein Nepgr_032172 [Nepenthes gracilis]
MSTVLCQVGLHALSHRDIVLWPYSIGTRGCAFDSEPYPNSRAVPPKPATEFVDLYSKFQFAAGGDSESEFLSSLSSPLKIPSCYLNLVSG